VTRSGPETEAAYASDPIKTGFNHAGPHPQRDLSTLHQDHPQWHGGDEGVAMTGIVTTVMALLSVGVFLAHAFDAYRTRPSRQF
jgi:hypothetical protein